MYTFIEAYHNAFLKVTCIIFIVLLEFLCRITLGALSVWNWEKIFEDDTKKIWLQSECLGIYSLTVWFNHFTKCSFRAYNVDFSIIDGFWYKQTSEQYHKHNLQFKVAAKF